MKYFFSINMTAAEFYPYYEGKAQQMVVTTTQGVRVQFPAMHMRKYLLSTGIKGGFCLETKNNKFLSVTKMA
ncbi:DUF2835 family protein [Colwellia hornerae]|uniref:DUF2835 family protein n=1 Tax=Colwellia hornerae TaxID=89402 RepID=A0A5C6QSE0_9GAMM|nr:DUF2835 family protein [Colwellia hornerae]TWX57682.1 DUF2835 family protein [Colwellia hornerae]TWX62587.1 DUF2835 family protein [Colwellia hornerae]TWX71498.1 DUF2835 family protein [Colwellia hornerae]